MKFTNIKQGNVSKQQEFTNNVIDINDSKLYSQYGRFLEEAPIYCKKYYKLNKINTTTDEGFGNIESNLGDTSPLRFNKILNVPIYGISDASLEIEDSDTYGIKMEYHNEAVIPPKVFQPYPGDYFVIEMGNKELLFKVIDVSYENIKSNPFYKIDFKFDKYFEDDIDKQVVDEYTCIFNNIGTDDTPLVKLSEYNKIDELKNIFNDLYYKYTNVFYNKNADCLLFKKYYDPYLTKFIKDNEVFKKDNTSFDYLILFEKVELGNKLNITYLDTIYDAIERREKCDFKNDYRTLNILTDTSYLGIAGNNYNLIDFPKVNKKDILYYNRYLDIDFYTNMTNNRLYDIGEPYHHLYNIIIKYINSSDSNVIEYIKRYKLRYIDDDKFDYFVLIPIVLYIIKKIIGNILINYNNKEDILYV